jgi:hypothetical protein
LTGDQTHELLGGTVNVKGEFSWPNGVTAKPFIGAGELGKPDYFPDAWQFYFPDGRALQPGETVMLPVGVVSVVMKQSSF